MIHHVYSDFLELGREIMSNKEFFLHNYIEMIRSVIQGKLDEEVMASAIQNLEELFPPHQAYVAIFQLDQKQEHLIKLASSKLPAQLAKKDRSYDRKKYKFSKEYFEYLVNPVFIPDINADERWKEFNEISNAFKFQSSWTLPLESSNHELLGIITIGFYNLYTPDIFTVRQLKQCSRLISVVLEMRKLVKEELVYPLEQEKTTEFTLCDLEKALAEEQFILYYQPYFSLTDEDIGVEALIRWNHPEKGILAPGAFLPLAEKTGFILKLEKWVLEKAINDARQANDKLKTALHLSINISATHLNEPNFPKLVDKLLLKHNFPPDQLTLEITERILVEPKSVTTLKTLKRKGIRISIDDFGTAYSALHYLKSLPVDELKIDRSFISDITSDRINKNIVEVIIRLGKDLNLTVVAEGVETKEQLELLREMNCSQVQGFYFSKPLPLEEFISRYKAKQFALLY